MTTTRPPAQQMAASDPNLPEGEVTDAPAHGTELTITESVVTSLMGMALGGAAIWFLAPICFTC